MKNKDDDSKAKSEEFLAFESLAKRIISAKKEKVSKKVARNSSKVKPIDKKQLQK